MSAVWSIVIPTFHRPELLKKAIASCYAQSGVDSHHLQIIVVDNSADGSAEHQCASLDRDNLHYVHEPRPGLAFARNCGIETATGDYLAFLDDDEQADVAWISELNNAFESSDADVVFGKVVPKLEDPDVEHCEYVTRFYTRDLGRPPLDDIGDRLNFVGTGNSAYRRAICFDDGVRADERFNLSGGEDIDLFRKLKEQGRRFAWAPGAVAFEWISRERASLHYLKERRRSQGQQRVDSLWRRGLSGRSRVPIFMIGGAIQAALHACLYVLNRAINRPRQAREHAVEVQGGIGKVLWLGAHRRTKYGTRDGK